MNLQESIRRILREETEVPLFIKRRFTPKVLEELLSVIRYKIEEGEQHENDIIYDTVRQFIFRYRMDDVIMNNTDQEYWESYLKLEKPLIEYVKSML
jgi:hypothetical protein